MMHSIRKMNNLHRLTRCCILVIIFILVGAALCLALSADNDIGGNRLSQAVYHLGGGAVLSAVITCFVATFMGDEREKSVWFCPLMAAGLSLCLLMLGYIYIGVWPLGDKSVMIVDLHHQYAPLHSELRSLLLHGGNFTYSFHIGLGANFIPTFSYYLASPFNWLLVLAPERYLPDMILLIILLKNALAAGAAAACVQYLTRRRTADVIAIAILYALMSYMLAYSWNIMWLDVVALTPLVVLAMERLLDGHSGVAYVLLLALALFVNYYIGFMLCIFLVLYFVVWTLREARTGRVIGRGFCRFAIGSLLGGGLAATLLVPTAFALMRTSAAGGGVPEFETNFPLFDLLGRLYTGATPTIRSGNLPNIYCGVVTVLLLPIYFSQRSIPLRRRLTYGGLLAVLCVSCTVNQWDLLWHGLHSPNDLPYRFSFLLSFACLLIAAQTLSHWNGITAKQILFSLAGSALYLVVWEKFGGENAPDPFWLYINLLLLAVYAGILLFTVRGLSRRAGAGLLLVIVTAELLIGNGTTLSALNRNEYYTAHDDYMDNDKTAATDMAVRRTEEIAEADGQVFYRMEYLPRDTCMDTALHHYNGITTFASSNPYQTTLFMGDLGYAINGVNSYLYNSFVAPCDALFGIRYVILDVELENHPQLKLRDKVAVRAQVRYIYENTASLPVGYYVPATITQYSGTDYAPFWNQNRLYAAMTGENDAEVYRDVVTESASDYSSISGSAFTKSAEENTAIYTARITEKGQYFCYVDCRAADNITVETRDVSESPMNTWSVTPYEPYIIDCGTLSSEESVCISINGKDMLTGNIYVVRLDTEETDKYIGTLAENGLHITEAAATRLAGTVTAPADGALYLSIPYDTGWTVVVDGEKANTFALDATVDGDDGALLCADLSAGTHDVELRYRAPGQWLGIGIAAVSVIAFIGLALLDRKRRRK